MSELPKVAPRELTPAQKALLNLTPTIELMESSFNRLKTIFDRIIAVPDSRNKANFVSTQDTLSILFNHFGGLYDRVLTTADSEPEHWLRGKNGVELKNLPLGEIPDIIIHPVNQRRPLHILGEDKQVECNPTTINTQYSDVRKTHVLLRARYTSGLAFRSFEIAADVNECTQSGLDNWDRLGRSYRVVARRTDVPRGSRQLSQDAFNLIQGTPYSREELSYQVFAPDAPEGLGDDPLPQSLVNEWWK